MHNIVLGQSELCVTPVCLGTILSPELLKQVDAIRREMRDPAQ